MKESSYSWTCRSFKPHATYLEPALRHEEVIFDPLFPKLLCSIEAHGSIFIINLPFVLVSENGVGIVDLFKFFCCFWIVWILVRVMPQSQFSEDKKVRGYKVVCTEIETKAKLFLKTQLYCIMIWLIGEGSMDFNRKLTSHYLGIRRHYVSIYNSQLGFIFEPLQISKGNKSIRRETSCV